MYFHSNHLASPDTLADAKSQQAAENAQRAETARNCRGVRVLEWLQRGGPGSLREHIAYLERRLAATPRLVEGHHRLRRLANDLNRALRAQGARAAGPLKARFENEKGKIYAAYPEIRQFSFPPNYLVRSVAEELAQVRCKLSRARLDFQIWNRTGQRPQRAGFLRLCSPQPGRPLTMWTIRGFGASDTNLNPSQLSEIKLIAAGLARNPRTRTGRPVVIITGGFAPGEDPGVGTRRAIVVRNALFAELKRIDLSLVPYVGFQVTTNAWCGEVAISMRERVAPPPNLRLPSNYLMRQRHLLAPTGTPLPAGPPAGPHKRSTQDQIRRRVDRILRKYGVQNATARKAVIDSAVFQGEAAVRSAVGKTGLNSKDQAAVVDEILSRKRP